jgi:transposase
MQGRQVTQMPLFVDGNLEKYVPAGHLLRKVAKVLDLGFIRQMTKAHYAGKGRPSLDPVVFFKMQIVAYLYGISSDRQLCDEVSCNLAYRWYLGYPLDQEAPDHSTLTRTRDRLGPDVFRKVFEKIVSDCKKVGLVQGQQVIVDASLIKANASKDSMKPRDGSDKAAPTKSQEIAEAKTNPKRWSKKNKTHVSKSDPDSTCVNRKGYSGDLYYKGHYAIDGKERIILDCHVTTGSRHECKEFIERLDHVADTYDLDFKEVLADSGYGHGPTYEDLKDRGIRPYIPLRDPKLGAGKHAPPEDFQYQKDHDRYRCPAGAFLYPHKTSGGITRYAIKNRACDGCPLQKKCFPKGFEGKSKRIQRSVYQDHFDKIRRRMKTATFKKKRYARSWKIEGIFGEAKSNHCLGRAKYRGLAKVQIQVYLSATVQNLKRIISVYGEGVSSIWRSLIDKIAVLALKLRIWSRFFFRPHFGHAIQRPVFAY